jgi:hypothetical protein
MLEVHLFHLPNAVCMPLDQGFVKTFHDNVAIDVGSG